LEGLFVTEFGGRKADHPIDKLFLQRWSPRAFTGEEISVETLLTILEAARWAPSAYNAQPWRFLYARRHTPSWGLFLSLLGDFNRLWAEKAAALVVIVSQTAMTPPGSDKQVPSYSHSFDAGSAWTYLALQGMLSGWATHAMTGFDRDRALVELNVPEGYRVEAAVAIGRQGEASSLPENLAAREKPNDRLPLKGLVFEGGFPPR
jgi:nitroreductase